MFKTSGNQLQVLCNRLQAFKKQIHNFKNISETTLATGNRLHPLVID